VVACRAQKMTHAAKRGRDTKSPSRARQSSKFSRVQSRPLRSLPRGPGGSFGVLTEGSGGVSWESTLKPDEPQKALHAAEGMLWPGRWTRRSDLPPGWGGFDHQTPKSPQSNDWGLFV